MKVFDVMCASGRVGRFMYAINAEAFRAKFITANELDDDEIYIRTRMI